MDYIEDKANEADFREHRVYAPCMPSGGSGLPLGAAEEEKITKHKNI